MGGSTKNAFTTTWLSIESRLSWYCFYCKNLKFLNNKFDISNNHTPRDNNRWKLMRSFWWGQKHQETKMAWVGWKTMCKPKSQGGMGFRNLQVFNLALLAKQAWRILTNPGSLVARILKAKYFPFCDILHANLRSSPSYTWQSIFNGLEVLRCGTRWSVGNGWLIHI